MIYILNIETTSTNCSVSLAKNGNCIQSISIDNGYTHAENLLTFIDKIIQLEEISSSHLSAISVSEGPGSYTGLRIGLATVKGLCYSLNIPLIAISTLQIMAATLKLKSYSKDLLLLPMIDARRDEVFCALFDFELNQKTKTQAIVINEITTELSQFKEDVYFFGSGASKAVDYFKSLNNLKFVESDLPDARFMCEISYKKFALNDFENVIYFEPNYVKDFFTTAQIN